MSQSEFGAQQLNCGCFAAAKYAKGKNSGSRLFVRSLSLILDLLTYDRMEHQDKVHIAIMTAIVFYRSSVFLKSCSQH